jgi:hypothetical protein
MRMLTRNHKLFNLVLILSAVYVNNGEAIEISSYARVSKNGDSISIQSDRGSRSNNQVSHVPSTLIDK